MLFRSQMIVIALLISWQAPYHAGIVAALLILQFMLMRRLLKNPEKEAAFYNATGTTLPLTAYIQSADFDLDDGYQFAFVKRLIPDITFSGSTDTTPAVTMTLYARDFPGGPYNQETDEPVARTATVPVEQYSEQKWVRLRGRQIAFRVSSESTGTQWSLGIPRIDVQPDGKR